MSSRVISITIIIKRFGAFLITVRVIMAMTSNCTMSTYQNNNGEAHTDGGDHNDVLFVNANENSPCDDDVRGGDYLLGCKKTKHSLWWMIVMFRMLMTMRISYCNTVSSKTYLLLPWLRERDDERLRWRDIVVSLPNLWKYQLQSKQLSQRRRKALPAVNSYTAGKYAIYQI